MFFKKNKKPIEPASFKPAKLSQEALDAFALKYNCSTSPTAIPYIIKSRSTNFFFTRNSSFYT